MQDEATYYEKSHSTAKKDTLGVVAGLRHYAGGKLKECVEFFTDNAQEFKAASRELGLPNPSSVPRRPQSNSRTETRMFRVGTLLR